MSENNSNSNSIDGFYRNTSGIRGIDPGALWKRQGDLITLVDDDQYIRVQFDPYEFEPIGKDETIPGSLTDEIGDMT